METTIQATAGISSREINAMSVSTQSVVMSDFWQKVEFNRFGIVPMLLIIIVSIGGIAAAVTIQESVIKLAVITISTIVAESFVLAVMPMRTIVISAIISIVLSLLMVVI